MFAMHRAIFVAIVLLGFSCLRSAVGDDVFPPPKVPVSVLLNGFFGERYVNNWRTRLLKVVDTDKLIAPFETRSSPESWVGEYIGKWLDAASLSYAFTHDAALRAKMDRAVKRLIATQESDGYLGTYPKNKRFIMQEPYTWDIWVHKYVMIGLLRYAQVTGDRNAQAAAQRAADLLLRTFGPGKKNISHTGTQDGMAATSVLQPMVWLYRATRDPRYLEFCRYIMRSWDEPGGPRILSALKAHTPANRIANGKAYEMLSNFLGLVEFAEVAGDQEIIGAVLSGWRDVYRNRLYITGSASRYEHFQKDDFFPFSLRDHIQETCVTVTWIQLTQELLRVTDNAECADALMQTLVNQLFGAQRPDGAAWCYYCALRGKKRYDTLVHCCSSNGPRAVAALPFYAVMGKPGQVDVLLYAPGTYRWGTGDRSETLTIDGNFPLTDRVVIHPVKNAPAKMRLRLFVPRWARGAQAILPDGTKVTLDKGPRFIVIERTWRVGDTVRIDWRFQPRIVYGAKRHPGLLALCYGPMVLAWDSKANACADFCWRAFALPENPDALHFHEGSVAGLVGPVFFTRALRRGESGVTSEEIAFRPWCFAGSEGGFVNVWFPVKVPAPYTVSLFAGSKESASDPGNVNGSICDEDHSSFRVTYNGRPQKFAWFAVERDSPVTICAVEYTHGEIFHDGGWYDASKGKPRIQIKPAANSAWQDLAMIECYPGTTKVDAKGLRGGERFWIVTPPTRCVAIRVIGHPACGDNPNQAFSSCAELRAFKEPLVRLKHE